MSSISSNYTGQLDTQYLQMINSLMEIERQPLVKLQEARDNFLVRKGIYADLKDSLDKLQTSTKALISTDTTYAFESGRKVTNLTTDGDTVLTATATDSAAPASYTFHVTSLAKAHRVMSDKQSSMTAALNLPGTIMVGGATIQVLSSDTLSSLANKINKASYESEQEVVASVVDAQLILTAKNSGTTYEVTASDVSGNILQTLGLLNADASFKNERAASDARFTINDLPEITRSSNTGLSDVINGVTINFAADAEGKDVTIDIQPDNNTETDAINAFISDFNSLNTYLSGKLSTVKQADGTYKRGSLAGDSSLFGLRMDLLRQINTDVSNTGTLKNLSQIGISLDSNMQLTVSDTSKLSEALQTDKTNVTKLIDSMMERINTLVNRFTGTDGYVASLTDSVEQQVKTTNSQIDLINERLDAKEESLFNQYAQTQSQISEMLYTQQFLSALYNSGY